MRIKISLLNYWFIIVNFDDSLRLPRVVIVSGETEPLCFVIFVTDNVVAFCSVMGCDVDV